MDLQLLKITNEDLKQFKLDMQEAFQLGASKGGYPMEDDCLILPEEDINQSLSSIGSIAYKAVLDNIMVGGAIILLNKNKHTGHLDFLYVKNGYQGKGIGKFIWFEIEKLHSEIYLWETCTPYFEKRNLHFYVNVCKFQVTDFWNDRHIDPNFPITEEQQEDDEDGMFGFKKEIKPQNKIPYPITINTNRLIIRNFEINDLQSYYQLITNPRVNCFKEFIYENIEQAKTEIEQKIKNKDSSELAIALKDTNEFIGLLFGMYEGDTFSVGWNFLEQYENKGYAYESSKAYFDYLFNNQNIRRIYAYAEENNLKSQKLCKKLGMRKEGEFKEFISFINNPDGTPHYENTWQYAILKKEWK